MDVYEAINERKSVRKYKAEPVSEEIIVKLFKAARAAPSWKNLQCWRFIVVCDAKRRQGLAASMPDSNPAKTAVKETAPLVIVLCADSLASGNQDGKDYYMLDAGLAMQQLMLAAAAEGLGTCWVGLFEESVAREAVEVPGGYRVVAMTPVGYPSKVPSPRPRKNIDEIVFSEKWGQHFST